MGPDPRSLGPCCRLMQQAQPLLVLPDDGRQKGPEATPQDTRTILREAGLTRGEARGLLAKVHGDHTSSARLRSEPLSELALLFNQFR